MATKLSPEIEKIGSASASPPPSSNPPQRKPRWPAVKKVLWGSNKSRYHLPTAKLNIKVPDYCPEHVPLHASFGDEQSLAPLLAEVDAKDTQLQDLFDSATARLASERAVLEESKSVNEEEERDTFEESVVQCKLPPEDLRCFQDFVSSFLSMFLQSKFLKSSSGISYEHDPTDLVRSLASNRSCPETPLFCRVAVDPKLLTAAVPDDDNPGFVESGVAVNQLARLLDVAVLQFLSTVNEHTNVHAILWALDYMKNLLSSLITSMNSLNSFGWYGAPHIRIRKGTAVGSRKTSAYLLQPPFFNPPPRVVVGTPPLSPNRSPEHVVLPPLERVEEKRDPVTGQKMSPTFSPGARRSPRLNARGGSLETSFPSGSRLVGQSGSGTELSERAATVSGGEGSQQGRHGILKVPSLESAIPSPRSPKLSRPHSPSHSPSSPNSPRFQHQVAAATERKRKVTPVPMISRPPTGGGSMGSIQEEDGEGHLMLVTSRADSMGSIAEVQEEEDEDGTKRGDHEKMFLMDSVEKDYFKNMQEVVGPPVHMSPSRHTPSPLELATRTETHSAQSQVWGGEVLPAFLGSPPSSGRSRSVSPQVMGSPPDFSPLASPLASPMRSPVRGRGLRSASLSPPPPLPKNTPEVDVDMELKTLMNGEGRISLLALLRAIANFPQSDEIWTEEVGERCFSLIQLCMDIGMPPQTDDASPKQATSGSERRKRFFKQDNKAFNKLVLDAEKPWKVHSKYTIKFAVEALIQCGTCSIVGCATDSTFCRLKQFHLAPSHGTAAYNRLIRSLRRIHLHSPAVFRQALIEFSQPSKSSCRRLFQFLHMVLQYCMHGGGEVCFNHLLASVVMSVMSVTVDRLVQLDITEPSIQDVSVAS